MVFENCNGKEWCIFFLGLAKSLSIVINYFVLTVGKTGISLGVLKRLGTLISCYSSFVCDLRYIHPAIMKERMI